jgi:predicted transglutaminase-like cysteine proteinase
VASALMALAVLNSPAEASLPRNGIGQAPEAPFIALGQQVLEPFAEVIFCRQYATECARNNGSAQVELTPPVMATIAAVNSQVNHQITPRRDDPDVMGGNVWRLAPAAGDCKDYAITKRHDLIEHGLPAGALRLAIVHTAAGEAHMVLVVSTSKGDLVLDNLTAAILPWRETRLSWEMMQSAADPRQWYRVLPPGLAPRPVPSPTKPDMVPETPAQESAWSPVVEQQALLTLPPAPDGLAWDASLSVAGASRASSLPPSSTAAPGSPGGGPVAENTRRAVVLDWPTRAAWSAVRVDGMASTTGREVIDWGWLRMAAAHEQLTGPAVATMSPDQSRADVVDLHLVGWL